VSDSPKHEATARRPDAGTTFIEILVALVLLGTIVVATLAGLRASIIGSQVDENSARAHAWLQAAADSIYTGTYLSCGTNSVAAIESAYQLAADAATRPAEWDPASGADIAVTAVEFLARSGATESWGPTCAAGVAASPLYPQLIHIEVTAPNGDFTAELELIKSA
jgi:type II secretory pathway pseudopilin PulG